jgi:hypothetical protein
VQRIDRGDDAIEAARIFRIGLGKQRVRDGCRIGETCCFYRDTAEWRQFAGCAPLPEHVQRVGDVAAHRAADAAVLQQHCIFDRLLDQQMIQADGAEFVDDHHGVGERWLAQQVVQHRGLAAAEEAGEYRHRNGVRRVAHGRRIGEKRDRRQYVSTPFTAKHRLKPERAFRATENTTGGYIRWQ